MINYAEQRYKNLLDPNWQGQNLNQQIKLGLPELNLLLSRNRQNLAGMGLYSSSPMATVTGRTIGDYTTGVTKNFYNNLSQEQMQLLPILAQLYEAEKRRKMEKQAALWGGIGKAVGFGARFIPGYGQANDLESILAQYYQGQ